jgi:hypothetical protein
MRIPAMVAPMLVVAVAAANGQKVARLTEDLRLDATAEDFPRVSAVVVGPREQIVVLVPNEMEFRVYDRTGKKIGKFGRTGSGPGEFRGVGAIGYVGDTIWIHDYTLQRVSWFGPDFKLLRTEPTPQPQVAGSVIPEGNRSGARFSPFLITGDRSMIGDASVSRSANARQQWDRFLGVQKPSGEVIPIPGMPDLQDPKATMFYEGFYRNVPFMTWPSVSVAVDGSRFGVLTIDNNRPDGGVMSITTYSLANWVGGKDLESKLKVEFSKRIQFTGERVPSSVRDSLLESFIPASGRPREGPSELPQRFQAMARERMPSFYAPAEGLLLGLDKTIWVMRPTRNDRWSADVYDGSGKLLGRVEPPFKTRIRHGTATHVWTTQRDEDDLISIVRYRITWQ